MKAPSFSLQNQDGQTVTLESFRGKKVILYCYPKAETPGCTTQACGLRDNISLLTKAGAVVVGISPDDVRDLKKFAQKYALPFTLLADPSTRVLQAYGVWGQKQFMGRNYMGVLRTTFVIDESGEIIKKYEKVNPETHASMLLADLGVVHTDSIAFASPDVGAKGAKSMRTVTKKVAKKAAPKKAVARKSSSKRAKKPAKKKAAKKTPARKPAKKKKK